MKQEKLPFLIGLVGIQFLSLGFVVFSARVFVGIGPIIYRIPPKYKSSGYSASVIVRLDNEVYPLEIMPSSVGLLLTTVGFGKETLKNISVVPRFPKPLFKVRDSFNFMLSLNLLSFSWCMFYFWLRAFLL